MEWSYTHSKIFSGCQRKWYYFDVLANSSSKDPLRKEAYLLKQLQSIRAWRGNVVDIVIQNQIIPGIKSHNLSQEGDILNYALRLADKQIAFAKAKRYRDIGSIKSHVGDDYCALYELEYDGGLDEEKIQKAKEDVVLSLRNLLRSNLLKEITSHNLYVIAQRQLIFQFEKDMNISCTPDMIVFFKDQSPLIVDWKVHFSGNTDAWLQLGIYAIGLSKVSPHKDFPENFPNQVKNPSDIRLIEFQLLRNNLRKYLVSPEDIADIEDRIFESFTQMKKLVNGRKYAQLDVSQFSTARSPRICERCQFKKLCWKAVPVQTRLLEEWA